MGGQARNSLVNVASDCQRSLDDLVAIVASNDCFVKDLLHGRDVQQLRERYCQWAGNLGALQPSESPLSLENRLRDAPLVRDSILKTLTDLRDSLQDATHIASGRRENRAAKQLIIDPDIDLSEYEVSSSDSDASSNASSGRRYGRFPTSEIQELASAIASGLVSLFRMSIFIRKFAPKEKRLRAAGTKPFNNRADIMHVKERYPLLNAVLAERLGEANARRRQYFKYRRDHHDRLSMVITRDDSEIQNIVPKQPEGAESVMGSQIQPTLFAKSEATAFVADAAAQARMLQVHEPEPAMSIVSYATSIVETSEDEIPFPPMPAEGQNGEPFLCPYCLTFQQLGHERSEHQWRNHVLHDLEPYVCTFPSCSLDTFQSQHAWFEHELLIHRSQWICPQCLVSFNSSNDLGNHIDWRHGEVISDRQLSTIIDQSKRPTNSIRPEECPFCDDSWAKLDSSLQTGEEVLVVNVDQFQSHLGRHLQQIALFALPRLNQDNGRSLGSDNVGGSTDRDVMSKGYRWGHFGRGWSIVLGRRGTFIALSHFLARFQYFQSLKASKSNERSDEEDESRNEPYNGTHTIYVKTSGTIDRTEEGRCNFDTECLQGNIVSLAFVEKLGFTPSDFKALTHKEMFGGTPATGHPIDPIGALKLTWYHPSGVKIFSNMRFLVVKEANYDLIVGAESIYKHKLMGEVKSDIPARQPNYNAIYTRANLQREELKRKDAELKNKARTLEKKMRGLEPTNETRKKLQPELNRLQNEHAIAKTELELYDERNSNPKNPERKKQPSKIVELEKKLENLKERPAGQGSKKANGKKDDTLIKQISPDVTVSEPSGRTRVPTGIADPLKHK